MRLWTHGAQFGAWGPAGTRYRSAEWMDVLWQVTEPLDTQDCCEMERIQRVSIGQVCANPPLQLEEEGGGAGSAELGQEPKGAEGRRRLAPAWARIPHVHCPAEGPRQVA